MDTQIPKKNVKSLNNAGFTLLEILFAFSVFCIIVSFFPVLIRIMINERPLEVRIQRMEWEVFISQIKKEIRMSNKLTVLNQTLILEKEGKVILYEKYGLNIRRRVDYKGHEILLQNVKSFKFEKIPFGVRVKVTNGDDWEYIEEVHSFLVEGVT